MDGDGDMSDIFLESTTKDTTEDTDDDSGASALQSMGYIPDGTEIRGTEGDSSRSVTSVLKRIGIIVTAVLFGVSFLYLLLKGVLAVFGIQLP